MCRLKNWNTQISRAARKIESDYAVILPVLDRGAKQLFFMEGRGGRTIAVYTSEDGGETWNKLTDVNTDKDSYHNT